ncbi:MAG TPA: Hsp33 family molecular chaperone [Stellaceae bacterium]|jgi:molecular chaperone Hsp33|nr:Hsp33 family molecular chaperone [Stellaceae bacterium]
MPQIPDDLVQPFQIEPFALRGRLVRLGPAIDSILTQHAYPAPVAQMLGEAITLAVALAGALKYEGVFTLQTKGDGPIKMMVADVTTAGALRGYAQFDAARLDAETGATGAVPRLLGAGYLALTVDQGEHTERYQGIVELTGSTLAECVHHYFRQSEQVEAALKVAVAQVPDESGAKSWRAGALMIQRLPREAYTLERETEDDAWRRAAIFMSSSTSAELIDPALAPERLLFRLFHEDGVRAYQPHPLMAKCRCSRHRVENVLRALKPDEIADMKVDGKITVTCEFCSTVYDFGDETLDTLVPG